MGSPPQNFYLKHRAEAAKKLLSQELLADINLIEIALALGFRSHPGLTIQFKKHVGFTPNEFRSIYS